MLGLHYLTPPEWAQRVLAQPEKLLLDHYFCELKAAAMARRTIKLYGERRPSATSSTSPGRGSFSDAPSAHRRSLKQLMLELADEEMDHARQCEAILKQGAWPQAERGGSPYAQGLRRLAHAGGHGTLLDMLLVNSLIEARSAERFKLLADAANGTPLGRFYEGLFASEVNHYVLFVGLGVDFYGEERTLGRLEDLRAGEAELMRNLPAGPKMHSGTGSDGLVIGPHKIGGSHRPGLQS